MGSRRDHWNYARKASCVAEPPLVSLIDDDAPLRMALAGLLRSFGHRVRDFDSAETFLASDVARESDCVVTDIHMPGGLSGVALQQRLAELGVDAPVVIITGRDELVLRERAFAGGAVCVLNKPFTPEALNACILRALAKRAGLS